jgi:hypothetical protein
VDFFEYKVTFRRKEGAVEKITSGNRIYQAYIDLERATARQVFEYINPDANNPTVPLSTVKNKTTDLKGEGLIEKVGKDGNAPIYAPVERPGGTQEDRPTHRPTAHTEDGGTVGRTLEGGPDDEGEKAEETSPPSSLNNIIGEPEMSEEEYEEEERLSRMPRKKARQESPSQEAPPNYTPLDLEVDDDFDWED